MELSKQFIEKLEAAPEPAYRLARKAGVEPSTFYGLKIGAKTLRPMDQRIIGVGALLGLSPEECFEVEESIA